MEPNLDLLLKTISCWTRPRFPPSAEEKPIGCSLLFPPKGEISGSDLSGGRAHPRQEGDGRAGGGRSERSEQGKVQRKQLWKRCLQWTVYQTSLLLDSSFLVSFLFPALQQTWHDRGESLFPIWSFGVPIIVSQSQSQAGQGPPCAPRLPCKPHVGKVCQIRVTDQRLLETAKRHPEASVSSELKPGSYSSSDREECNSTEVLKPRENSTH